MPLMLNFSDLLECHLPRPVNSGVRFFKARGII
jgi:hypothetical protein